MSEKGGVRVHVGPKLELLTRANLIGHAAREIAATMGFTEKTLVRIHGGFKEKLLRRVSLYVYSDEGREVMEVAVFFSVDWERHRAILSTPDAEKEFSIDPAQPIAEQISRLLGHISAYVKTKVDRLDDPVFDVTYQTVPDQTEVFRARYNTYATPASEQEQIARALKGLRLSARPARLSEVSVELLTREDPPEDDELFL